MLNISIKTIPHNEQRYETCGDYWRDKHKQYFRISDMQDKDYEFMIAIHELVEAYLCERNAISWESIDRFDMNYEKQRKDGDTSEPGDDPKAPYYEHHQFGTAIERLLCHELGRDWNEYSKTVDNL